MRKTINLELRHADIQAARAIAFRKSPTGSNRNLTRELAALAGSRYLMGGTATYRVLSRGVDPGTDVPGANISFIGLDVAKREDIWELQVLVEHEDRRKGWIYVPVAISPIKNQGSEEKPLYRAFAIVIGYKQDGDDVAGNLRFAALDTDPPFPLRWRANGEGSDGVQWPIKRPRGGAGRAGSGAAGSTADPAAKPEGRDGLLPGAGRRGGGRS